MGREACCGGRAYETGYIVEFDLDGKKRDAGRTVEVTGKTPPFALMTKSELVNFGTIDELLKGLGGRYAG